MNIYFTFYFYLWSSFRGCIIVSQRVQAIIHFNTRLINSVLLLLNGFSSTHLTLTFMHELTINKSTREIFRSSSMFLDFSFRLNFWLTGAKIAKWNGTKIKSTKSYIMREARKRGRFLDPLLIHSCSRVFCSQSSLYPIIYSRTMSSDYGRADMLLIRPGHKPTYVFKY